MTQEFANSAYQSTGEREPASQTVDRTPGRTLPVPVVNLACCGCGWRGAASSLDGLNNLAREHDDSPFRQHIVTLSPPGRWPEDDSEFRALLTAPASEESR